ncbi:hypothetical protein KR018_010525, partial [Drosophila ironensis]
QITIYSSLPATIVATLLCNSGSAYGQLLDEDDDLAFGRPWPTYSLQNMPKTQFTCHDKILGGYYADPETQCQMFHVCVKLPGVGLLHRRVNPFVQQVQDYRFLCPNTTAFDQELQICANWADVDCGKATSLYDKGDLNDLYRGGDESKAANEEEATFHLQRAETGDVRRSKENHNSNSHNNRGGDQKTRPRHNYAQTGGSSGFGSTASPSLEITQPTRRPISTYYSPSTLGTTTTSTTTTSTTERSYYNHKNNNYNSNFNNNYGSGSNNDDSKQDVDDIFKGSHSSHFFANRHGGREFDEEISSSAASSSRPKPNDLADYQSRKTTPRVTSTTRVQRPSTTVSPSGTTSYTSSTPASTKSLKKITLHASFNTDFLDSKATTPRPSSSITSRFSFNSNDFNTQERIQPTTYNPNNGAYRFKTTPAPASSSTKVTGKGVQDFEKPRSKPTVAIIRKQKLGPQESNYINHNEFADLAKPQPFQAPGQQIAKKTNQLEPHYQRHKPQVTRVGAQEPAPFAAPSSKPRSFTSRGSITYKATTERYTDGEIHYPTTGSTAKTRDVFTPTTFRPTTYKKPYEQTQLTHRPTVQLVTKKVAPSTAHPPAPPALPTTANPYYNVDEDDGQYHPELYESDFPRNRFKFLRSRSSSSTSTSTTSSPAVSSRQPHGFQQTHSHLKSQQQSIYQREREREREADLSDEDELFKTAQSLNFGAASINKLRADIYKAEKTSQQYNSQYSPQLASSSPQASSTSSATSTSTTTTTTTTPAPSTTRRPTTIRTTTSTSAPSLEGKKSAKSKKEHKDKEKPAGKRPPHADEDTSYDYAYYDTD